MLLDRGDAQIYYESHGSGPTIVFAHGLGGNHLSWWQQVPHFRDRYRCVVFSHRGFHGSPAPAETIDPAHFVDDLAALVDHLDVPDVRLVAQSMGGWSCLAYALRQPERVRALALCSTAGTVVPLVDAAEQARLEAGQPTSAELAARGVHPGAGERMAREQPALHFLYSAFSELNVGLDRDAVRERIMAAKTLPTAALAGLTMPVLCIAGEDEPVMPTTMQRLAEQIPNARFELIGQSNHSTYFERAAVFNRAIDSLLDSAAD